jgi:Putative Actinobacterial Holin-X, holin superfamily III
VVDQTERRDQSFSRTQDGNDGRQWNEQGFDRQSASTGQLVSQAAEQITTLVRNELALGKTELTAKGKKLGLGGAMLAAAGLFGLFTFGLVVALIVAVLDIDWPLWLAALVPLLALGVITLGLVGLGIRQIRSGASAPQTTTSVRDDIHSARDAFQEGRHGS